MSSHEQDLPDTTLFCRCLSLGRVTERQFLANWDNQLAIAHGLGHELQRFPVEFREYVHHFYRRVFRGVLRHLYNRCIDSPGLTLAISFSAVLPPTVSATASSVTRLAIAVSSSVASA